MSLIFSSYQNNGLLLTVLRQASPSSKYTTAATATRTQWGRQTRRHRYCSQRWEVAFARPALGLPKIQLELGTLERRHRNDRVTWEWAHEYTGEEGPERVEERYTSDFAVWYGKERYGALKPTQSRYLIQVLDDDKIQEFLYETTQIEKPAIGVDIMNGSAATTALNSLSAGASGLKDQGTCIMPQFCYN